MLQRKARVRGEVLAYTPGFHFHSSIHFLCVVSVLVSSLCLSLVCTLEHHSNAFALAQVILQKYAQSCNCHTSHIFGTLLFFGHPPVFFGALLHIFGTLLCFFCWHPPLCFLLAPSCVSCWRPPVFLVGALLCLFLAPSSVFFFWHPPVFSAFFFGTLLCFFLAPFLFFWGGGGRGGHFFFCTFCFVCVFLHFFVCFCFLHLFFVCVCVFFFVTFSVFFGGTCFCVCFLAPFLCVFCTFFVCFSFWHFFLILFIFLGEEGAPFCEFFFFFGTLFVCVFLAPFCACVCVLFFAPLCVFFAPLPTSYAVCGVLPH